MDTHYTNLEIHQRVVHKISNSGLCHVIVITTPDIILYEHKYFGESLGVNNIRKAANKFSYLALCSFHKLTTFEIKILASNHIV